MIDAKWWSQNDTAIEKLHNCYIYLLHNVSVYNNISFWNFIGLVMEEDVTQNFSTYCYTSVDSIPAWFLGRLVYVTYIYAWPSDRMIWA